MVIKPAFSAVMPFPGLSSSETGQEEPQRRGYRELSKVNANQLAVKTSFQSAFDNG